jgi:hypothetical protein
VTLKDPGSLQDFAVDRIEPMHWYQGLLYGNRTEAAWGVCVHYNAKNSYGGYVGLRQYLFAMRDGGIITDPQKLGQIATNANRPC